MHIKSFSEIPDDAIDMYATECLKNIDLQPSQIFDELRRQQPKVYSLISSDDFNLQLVKVSSISMSMSNLGKEINTYHLALRGSEFNILGRCFVGDETIPEHYRELINELPDFIRCYYQHSDGLQLTEDDEVIGIGLVLPNSLGDFRNLQDYIIEHEYNSDTYDFIIKKYPNSDMRVLSQGLDDTLCLYDMSGNVPDIILVNHKSSMPIVGILENAEQADDYYSNQLRKWVHR